MNNDPKENKTSHASEDPDLILLDRILTKTGGVVFPPPPKFPDATDEQVASLMKATESIRNPTSPISEDPDQVLLDQILTKTGSIVFPPRTNFPDATDEQVASLMKATENIRNPKPRKRRLHFPTKRFLAIAASLAVIFGLGLRSFIIVPSSSFAVIIDFSPPHRNAADFHLNPGTDLLGAVAISPFLIAAKQSKGSSRSLFITGAVAAAASIIAPWKSHLAPFCARIAAKFPSGDQKLIQAGILQALDGVPQKASAQFFFFSKDRVAVRLFSKERVRNVVYVTRDPWPTGLQITVFEAKTGNKLVEAQLQTDDPLLQRHVEEKVSEWVRDGLL